ncbi:MAG: VanZ family protein [Desulfocapsa sp.]|nr:VanZ family protein [Desulfocapsa sp.]
MTLVMGTIFFLSHQSGDSLNFFMFPGADKLAHFLAYGTLALSVFWYHGKKGLKNPGRTAGITVVFCLLYGLSDEFHQSFIALRFVSGLDLVADAAGALCVSLVWLNNVALRQQMVCWQEGVTIKK